MPGKPSSKNPARQISFWKPSESVWTVRNQGRELFETVNPDFHVARGEGSLNPEIAEKIMSLASIMELSVTLREVGTFKATTSRIRKPSIMQRKTQEPD